MFRSTISKIGTGICTKFNNINGDLKSADRKVVTRTYEALSILNKSTDSTQDEDHGKRIKYVDKRFTPKAPQDDDVTLVTTEYKYNNDTPKRCQKIIDKCFKNDSKIDGTDVEEENLTLEGSRVHVTTAKIDEDKLAQKIETIKETPLVEAEVTHEEGFNAPPKVLGKESENWSYLYTQFGEVDHSTEYDELAKRCIGKPLSEIDDNILKELRRLANDKNARRDPSPFSFLGPDCVKYNVIESNERLFDNQIKSDFETTQKYEPIHDTKTNTTDAITTNSKDSEFVGVNSKSLSDFRPKYNREINVNVPSANTNPPNWYSKHTIGGEEEDEQDIVIPNTAISGTLPERKQTKPRAKPATAISAHQEWLQFKINTKFNLDGNTSEYYSLAERFSTSQINKKPTEETIPCYPYLYPISHFLFEAQLKPLEEREIPKQTARKCVDEINSAKLEHMPLSQMLKMVRERSRRELHQNSIVMKNPCLPPLSTGKPKDSIGPPACQPKRKSKKNPSAKPQKPKQNPCGQGKSKPKTNPCAKFVAIVEQLFKNALNITPEVRLFRKYDVPIYDIRRSLTTTALTETGSQILHRNKSDTEKWMREIQMEVRGFEPWIPIPSWPIPKKEKKRPFVCPKDGCKMIPPPNFHGPCKDNPCRSFPKRTFSPTFLPYSTKADLD